VRSKFCPNAAPRSPSAAGDLWRARGEKGMVEKLTPSCWTPQWTRRGDEEEGRCASHGRGNKAFAHYRW